MTLSAAFGGGFFTYLLCLQVVAMAAAALLLAPFARSSNFRLERGPAFYLGGLWIAAVTVEYWILGDRSYSAISAETDYSVTGLLMMIEQPAGARFAPGFAGGNDLYAFATFSGQLVSLERLLIAYLPLGGASFVHKTLVAAVGFIGTYRLSRSWARSDRVVPLLLAALFTLSHERLTFMTWSHGLGFALVPLAAYLFVRRQHRPYYLTGVVVLSAVQTFSCTPTHSYLAVIGGVLAVAIVDDRSAPGKTILALAISLILVIANWHESFYAKYLIGPFTSRGSAEPAQTLLPSATYLLMGVVGVLLLAGRRRRLVRGLAALAFGLFAGMAAQGAVAHLPLLGPLRSINFGNMQAGFFVAATAVFMLGWVPGNHEEDGAVSAGHPNPHHALLVVVLFAAAIGNMAWYKAYNVLAWLSEGGLSTVSGAMSQLRSMSKAPDEETRVVSIPYRLPANVASAAGLRTFDGVYPLVLASMEAFWNAALYPKTVDAASAYLDISGSGVDFKCCPFYTASDFVDLDLLRLANVGFILSTVPLRGTGISPIVPDGDVFLPRTNDAPLRRFLGYLELLRSPPRVLVYALGQVSPRVYIASSVTVSEADPGSRAFYELAARVAHRQGIAVGVGSGLTAAFGQPGLVEILAVTTTPEETVVSLRTEGSGIVVLNAPHSPFWRAYADDSPVHLTPANGIQMAAAFPAGTKAVRFRYERPLLRERLQVYFSAGASARAAR